MFNTPLALFKDRDDADITLKELRGAYADYLRAREKSASEKTIAHYMDTILSFEKSLVLHGKPATIGQLTPQSLRTWVADQRAGACRARAPPAHSLLGPDDSSAPRGAQGVQPQVHL